MRNKRYIWQAGIFNEMFSAANIYMLIVVAKHPLQFRHAAVSVFHWHRLWTPMTVDGQMVLYCNMFAYTLQPSLWCVIECFLWQLTCDWYFTGLTALQMPLHSKSRPTMIAYRNCSLARNGFLTLHCRRGSQRNGCLIARCFSTVVYEKRWQCWHILKKCQESWRKNVCANVLGEAL